MNRIIVVGAGKVGVEVAQRINNSVLIEADPAKFTILKRQNPDRDIQGGDARQRETLIRSGIEKAEALVLVTNKDYVNQKVALAAREFSVPKVVSILHHADYRQALVDAGVTHIISPISETVDAMIDHVFPSNEMITDIVVTRDSPVFKKRIADIKLPSNSVIGAVLKGKKLIKPLPEMVLEEGDVLSLVSLGELDVEVYETIAGGFKPYIPSKKVVFLLISADDLRSLGEAAFLAKRLHISCEVVMDAKDAALKVKARALLEKAGCEHTFNLMIGDLLVKFREYVHTFGPNSDILVTVHQGKKGMFGHLLPIKFVNWLLNNTTAPLLIARGNRYERVLHLLDSTKIGERCARCAVGLAMHTSSNLFALYPHKSGSVEHTIVRTHSKRMARIYDIDVIEDIIEGDPTIEFVQKIRAKHKQLVVLNWSGSAIRKDIMTRIVHDADASVLIVERQGKV